jgi:hypothetical protein
MNKLDRKRDQFVVVCAESLEAAQQLIPTARHAAEQMHKGLMLLTCAEGGGQWAPQTGIPYVSLRGDWQAAIAGLPTVFNAILAVTLADHKAPKGSFANPRQMLDNFAQCKVAYIVVNADPEGRQPVRYDWRRVAITLDHRRESKEKVIWASYLARFFGSRITVWHRQYSDGGFQSRLENNIRYMDKIFGSFGLEYERRPYSEGSQYGNPDLAAAPQCLADLYVAQVPERRLPGIPLRIGVPNEQKLLRLLAGTPVLFLNERDDLYILCD